jgi:DNA-binding NtrC family response regulator
MRKQSAFERNPTAAVRRQGTDVLTVLSVSPLDQDHLELLAIVGHSTWMLFTTRNLRSALPLLQERDISVVICERDLLPGHYSDVLEQVNVLRNPPSLIVASRLADDRLWAEALNLGAWDVLTKPFVRSEVLRSVKSGWQHWYDQIGLRTSAGKTMAAAG